MPSSSAPLPVSALNMNALLRMRRIQIAFIETATFPFYLIFLIATSALLYSLAVTFAGFWMYLAIEVAFYWKSGLGISTYDAFYETFLRYDLSIAKYLGILMLIGAAPMTATFLIGTSEIVAFRILIALHLFTLITGKLIFGFSGVFLQSLAAFSLVLTLIAFGMRFRLHNRFEAMGDRMPSAIRLWLQRYKWLDRTVIFTMAARSARYFLALCLVAFFTNLPQTIAGLPKMFRDLDVIANLAGADWSKLMAQPPGLLYAKDSVEIAMTLSSALPFLCLTLLVAWIWYSDIWLAGLPIKRTMRTAFGMNWLGPLLIFALGSAGIGKLLSGDLQLGSGTGGADLMDLGKQWLADQALLAVCGLYVITKLVRRFFYDFALAVRRSAQVEAGKHIDLTQGKAILVLRSFLEDDSAIFQTRAASLNGYGRQFPFCSLLQTVVDAAYKFRPSFGAYNRYSSGPDIIMPAETFPHEDWKPQILDRMSNAETIIYVMGDTDGLIWELERIIEQDYLDKTIFLLPPAKDATGMVMHGVTLRGVERLADVIAPDGRFEYDYVPRLAYRSPGREGWNVLGFDYSTQLGYSEAVRLALSRR